MKQIFIGLIKLYQKGISPYKKRGSCCRFDPTCSQYAVEAIEKFGVFKGGLLSAWRILRCNPFCRWGYDPVPDEFYLRKSRRK